MIIKKWWTKSIARQLMLGIALVHALLMTLFVFDLVQRERHFLLELSEKQAIGLVNTLATNGSSWLLANDFIGIEEVINAQVDFPDLRYAMFSDLRGQVLGYTDSSKVSLYLNDEISQKILNAPPVQQLLINNHSLIDVASPVYANQQHIGWARVGISRDNLLKNINVVTRNGMIYTLIAIIIGLLFAWLMARGLTSSIQQLVHSLHLIEQGKQDTTVVLDRNDEIGFLSRHLAQTVSKLHQIKQQLRASIQQQQNTIKLLGDTHQQLKEQESQLNAIINNVVDSIITINDKGNILSFNQAAETLFGYSAAEIIGKNIKLLMPELYSRDHDGYLSRFMKTKKTNIIGSSQEVEGQKKNQSFFPLHLSISEINQKMFVGLIRDISLEKQYQKQLENEVLVRTEALDKANQELNNFAYVVSHDLKAPLRAINQLAGWIAEDYAALFDEDGREQMALLQNRAIRMHDMIEGILAYSQIGRVINDTEELDVQLIINEVIEALSPPPHIQFEIQAELPLLCGERLRFYQVIQNLFDNAIKYNDKKQGLIQFSCSEQDNYWCFCIQDNGVGIAENHQDKIFQLFQTLTSKDKNNSTGVGLSIIEKTVEQWTGKIWLTSTLGKGSQFYFTYPKKPRNDQ